MSEENKNVGSKAKKEKKYFGFMDFTENTNRWGKVFMVALIVLFLSFSLSRIYEMYNKEECAETGCAENTEQEIVIAEKQLEMNLEETGESLTVGELDFKLYEIAGQNEYVMVGWEEVIDQGKTIRDVIKGIEEKEMIPMEKDGEYLFVWGNPEERLVVEEGEAVLGEYSKEKERVQLITIQTENSENINFEQ